MDKKASDAIKYTLSFALAGVMVWLAFRKVEWSSFWEGLRQTRWAWVILFFAASLLALFFRTLRWQALLKPLGGKNSKMLIWDANNVGNLANVVLPGSGEFVRCGYLSGGAAGYEKVFGTVVMERICDVAAIVVLFVTALVFGWEKFGTFFRESIIAPMTEGMNFSLWWILLAVVAVLGAAGWAVWHFRGSSKFCARIVSGIQGFLQGFVSFSKMDRKWLFVLYTVLIWLMYILMFWSILKAMPALEGLSFIDAVFLSAVGNIASVIPVPGGIGAYHYLIALTLSSLYGVPWETGLLNATLNHELHAVLIIILGIVSYFLLTLRKKKD